MGLTLRVPGDPPGPGFYREGCVDEVMRGMLDDRGTSPAESLGWTPACDVFEDAEEVVIRVALAGVDPKDVEIRFENGVLTLPSR